MSKQDIQKCRKKLLGCNVANRFLVSYFVDGYQSIFISLMRYSESTGSFRNGGSAV